MSKKLIKLEAIRGFAAVYVLLHHTFSKDFFLFRFGQEAVILFFLLSGFVIRYAYDQSNDKSFATFFLKRFLRIYIPLIAVFIANYVLLSLTGKGEWTGVHVSPAGAPPIDWRQLVENLLMLQDSSVIKPGVICEPFLGNQPLWSLSYEWWFYMLFFLCVTYLRDKAAKTVYITGTIAALTYLVYPNFVNRELMYFIIWWIGADMAKLYIAGKPITIATLKRPLLFLTTAIGILLVNVALHRSKVSFGMSPVLEMRHFTFAFIALLIAIVWRKAHWFGFNQTLGLFAPLAPISFGIYISHWFLVADAAYLNGLVANPYLRVALYIAVCFLFSYLVERVLFLRLNKYILSFQKTPINGYTKNSAYWG